LLQGLIEEKAANLLNHATSLAIPGHSFCKRTPEKLAGELMFICGLKCDQGVKEGFLRLKGVFLTIFSLT
jgi:hypothetical protein